MQEFWETVKSLNPSNIGIKEGEQIHAKETSIFSIKSKKKSQVQGKRYPSRYKGHTEHRVERTKKISPLYYN